MKNSQHSIVKENLSGKNILITGCTGFLGKVLLEKIIRSIPDVASINILIRANTKYNTAQERFENEILSSTIFDHLKEIDDDAFKHFCETKLNIISGELTQKQFGLDTDNFASLANNIDIIVNSAASVNFREALDKALKINTLCLHNIIELSKKGGDTPVVQVSTCYVNGFNKGNIYEDTSAPSGRDYSRKDRIPRNEKGLYQVEPLISRLKDKISSACLPSDSKDTQIKSLVDLGIAQAKHYGWNDTYTFTKWMGEQLLIEKLDTKSLAIVRPAIIESTLQGPVPGWIEGIKVADAIVFAYARGKIAYFPANDNAVMDIIPADLVANSIILAMTKVFVSPNETNIYQSCSSGSNPAIIGELKEAMVKEAQSNYRAYPKLFKNKKPAKEFTFVSKSVFETTIKALKMPLGLLHDVRSLLGQADSNDKMLKNIDTALTLSTTFAFYGFPKYRFHNGKLMALAEELGEKKDGEFPVDAKLIKWKKYFGETHLAGLEKYALKESKVAIPSAPKVKKADKA
ncbi:MAG: thioester reductase-like protein [Oleiphilaceae bacterium]|jgi:thioester reductase-like protein